MTVGNIHSFQSLGAVDGPGIRFVAFLQGCNLRCGCCHNPDTHSIRGGTEYTAEQIISKAKRYKEYFGKDGGITLSGGEPLMQADFAYEIFSLAHNEGIDTCLDTSGSVMNDSVKRLLAATDRVLLDIKYTNDADYKRYAGCSIDAPLKFLSYLNEKGIPTVIRQVIIPTLNDTKDNVFALKNLTRGHSNIKKIELLPFRKICEVKYNNMKIPFPFAHIPEPDAHKMEWLRKIIEE